MRRRSAPTPHVPLWLFPTFPEASLKALVGPACVYFISAGHPPEAVMVGLATKGKLRERLRTMQNSNHQPLILLGLIEADTIAAGKAVREAHKQFSASRRVVSGWAGSQWYTPSRQLDEYIRERTSRPDESEIHTSEQTPTPDDWQPSFVFFIAAGDPPRALKIGVAPKGEMIDLLAKIQTDNYEPLYLLGLLLFEEVERPAIAAFESARKFHKRFSAWQKTEDSWPRHRWFTATKRLLTDIELKTDRPADYDIEARVVKPVRYAKRLATGETG